MLDSFAPSLNNKQVSDRTILVVEDDEDLGEILMQIIEEIEDRIHYHGILATDSMQALEISKDIRPHLFLLDYYLPRMNGLDLYDRLHATEGLEAVPAIFLSANPPLEEIAKRHLVSMRKPFNIKDLVHAIEEVLAPQLA